MTIDFKELERRYHMWCEYCLEYHPDAKKVYRDEIEDYLDLCPDCANEETLETCPCGEIATHDGHYYCAECQ